MKKIIFTFLSLCIAGCMWAQKNVVFDPNPQYGQKVNYSILSTTADSTMSIYWETADTMYTSMGAGSASSMSVFMEFYPEDILNFKGTGKKLSTINQINFYIAAAYRANVTSFKLIVMQGNDVASATEVVNQNVDIASLVDGWNAIDLAASYSVDAGKNLYIGCQFAFNAKAYPFGVIKGTNVKQGWYRSGTGSYSNAISAGGYALMIKAVAGLENAPANEIALNSVDVPQYKIIGDSILVKGVIKNVGTDTLKSFKVFYNASGSLSDTFEVKNINVAANATYTFTHPKYYVCSVAKNLNIAVTVSEPNGVVDVIANNTQTGTTQIYSEIVPRVVLQEVFTSSTCPPCNPGNAQLTTVLNTINNPAKWACVKYQYNFPGTGDPYYTAECGTRGSFYGGISSVPTLNGDGTALVTNPNSYTVAQFNTLAQIPAAVKLSGTSNIDEKTVSLNVTIDPASNIINSNLRFFAAIVEKTTVKNVKSNGEKSFNYVMKKFMTNVNGDKIDSLQIGTPKALNYSYTFNGEYRLPANSSLPINHATENSVENFNNLMVVYWVQDISTKAVYQAGSAVDPDPHGTTSISSVANEINLIVYPNPAVSELNINLAKEGKANYTICNIEGKTIKQGIVIQNDIIDIKALPTGMYVLKLVASDKVNTVKFIKE